MKVWEIFVYHMFYPHYLLLFRIPMPNLIGHKGELALADIGFSKQIVSMGHQASGALELWNYPMWLRDIIPQNVDGQDRPDHVDLPALEGNILAKAWR